MPNKTIKLAEALLLRKELQNKVDQLKPINIRDLFVTKVVRKNVTESVDDVVATVPQVSTASVTKAYDHHARMLRHVDAVIQQQNWTAEVDVPAEALAPYDG